MKSKTRKTNQYRKRKLEKTQGNMGFLLFILFVIAIVTLFQWYGRYAVAVGALILVWLYLIFQFLGYKKDIYYYKNTTFLNRCAMDPLEFEHLCEQIVIQLGYKQTKVTPAQRDGWVDIRCMKDNQKVAIQCKRYNGRQVWVVEMRALYWSAAPESAKGIMMTTSTCSKDAMHYAKANWITIRDKYHFENEFVELLHKAPSFYSWFQTKHSRLFR
jgi:restriction system protein